MTNQIELQKTLVYSQYFSQISVNQNLQDKIVNQILIQSSGIGLGIIISMISAVLMFKWLGADNALGRLLDKIDKGVDSLNNLSIGISQVSRDADSNYKRSIEHKDLIIDRIHEVKVLIKEDILPGLKEIENKLK